MQLYMPFAQDPPGDFTARAAHGGRAARRCGRRVEAVVASISRDMPVSRVRTMEQVLDESIARQRMALLVLSCSRRWR